MNNAGEYTDTFKGVIHINLTASEEGTKNCWLCHLTSETRHYITIFYKNIETCTDTKPKRGCYIPFSKIAGKRVNFLPLDTTLSTAFSFSVVSYVFLCVSFQLRETFQNRFSLVVVCSAYQVLMSWLLLLL